MNKIEIGNKISNLRKEKGYTQKQLAEKLYVTDRAVSNWERGYNLPDLAILEPLAKELDISIVELLGLENNTDEMIMMNMVKIGIEERNRIVDSIKRENFNVLIYQTMYFVVLLIAYGLAIKLNKDDALSILVFISSILFGGIGFTLGASIRNHYRIKKYYEIKMDKT